jgi:4-hydroxy-4-methyl-2-oxoglutarate aldolase
MSFDYDALASELYSAVVSDILDSLGHRDQVVRSGLEPVGDGDGVLVGRARALKVAPVSEVPERPYRLLLQTIDSLVPGEVLVLDADGRVSSGLFGGLLATASAAAGGRGAIINGGTRDVAELRRQGFPTFRMGQSPADSLGRDDVVAVDEPIECGGVRIASGDLLVADSDGVVVVPAELAEEVVEKALEKIRGENQVREKLAAGMKPSEAFERYGIL